MFLVGNFSCFLHPFVLQSMSNPFSSHNRHKLIDASYPPHPSSDESTNVTALIFNVVTSDSPASGQGIEHLLRRFWRRKPISALWHVDPARRQGALQKFVPLLVVTAAKISILSSWG
jgi:hypothetical protein